MSRQRFGVHKALEEEADRLIKIDMSGSRKLSDKADILTPAKEDLRRRREIFVPSGTPDPALRQGMYHRALNRANADLNSRDGISRSAGRSGAASSSTESLRAFVHRSLES